VLHPVRGPRTLKSFSPPYRPHQTFAFFCSDLTNEWTITQSSAEVSSTHPNQANQTDARVLELFSP